LTPLLPTGMLQLSFRLNDRDPRWHCQRSYTKRFGNMELFFTDTNPFINEYKSDSAWSTAPGGLSHQSSEAQLVELEARLAASNAAWKFVIGHHPGRSNGEHGNNQEIIDNIEPLCTRFRVQVRWEKEDVSTVFDNL
jgi:tartrate-resistant acid phosphatase type 5